MSKYFSKSQISIFVIIALIIVLGGIVFFSLKSDNLKFFTDQKSSYIVKKFVQDCMDQETITAEKQIGLHGGWLYHPAMRFASVDENEYLIKNAKGFDHFAYGEIPYWYYYDDSDKVFRFNIPEFDSSDKYSFKNQIKKYLDDNLENDCIKSFSSFDNIYKIKYEPREIDTKVSFKDNKIIVDLNLPLHIISINANSSEYIDSFEVKEDNKLKVPYYLARDITFAEAKNSFVEFRVLNFLTAYQSSDGRDLLPPFYEFKMGFDKSPWLVKNVKKLAENIIHSNIGVIQFLNTDYNVRKTSDSLKQSAFANNFYQSYVKDYISNTSLVKDTNPAIFNAYRNYKVKPVYQTFYPTYFNLQPSMGNVLLFPQSEAIFGIFPFFFTQYTAVYQMTFPVLFQIKPDTSNNHFVFNLLLEANIDHNTPLKQNKDINLGNITQISSAKSLICEPSQFNSAYVSLNITDPVEHGKRKHMDDPIKGVDGAIVSFNCKGLSTCFIGQTKINGEYIQKNKTMLRFRLPLNCNPGTLDIYKNGYKKLTFDNLDPQYNKPINLGEVYMPSTKKFRLKVNLIDPSNSRYSTGKSLKKGDDGFLIFQNLEDKEVVDVVKFNDSNQYNLNVSLMPGNYSIQGFVIYKNGVTIPSEKFCYKKGLFSGDECQNVPAINMKSWVRAGIDIKNFNVPLNWVLSRNTLTVNMVDFGIPQSYSDLEKMSNSMNNVATVSQSKMPYFD